MAGTMEASKIVGQRWRVSELVAEKETQNIIHASPR
jgi:hypothetical protein